MKTACWAVALLILGVLAWPEIVEFIERCGSGKRSEQADKEVARRRLELCEEIKTLGNHAWAGDYYCGADRGMYISLILAPRSGYVFEWRNCTGLYDRNYGAVTCNDDILHMSLTFPKEHPGTVGFAEEYIPISWGDRKYLVPTNDVVGFCNEVNAGNEPRTRIQGQYLLRRGDEAKDVKEFPSVPQRFNPFLLSHAIDAEIIGVGKSIQPSDSQFKELQVTLNRGKAHGLLVGMTLNLIEPHELSGSITVVKVDEGQSDAVVSKFDKIDAEPQIGWKLSTRSRLNPVTPSPAQSSSR